MKIPLDILLVEDNEGDVEMTERALQESVPPCRLSVVNDGTEALEYLRKEGKFRNASTPHIILLDLNMPRMDGKRFLEVVKQDDRLKPIPVVVLTSSKAPSDIVDSYARHASCYVVKPFDSEEFMDAVRQVADFWRNRVLLPHETAAL